MRTSNHCWNLWDPEPQSPFPPSRLFSTRVFSGGKLTNVSWFGISGLGFGKDTWQAVPLDSICKKHGVWTSLTRAHCCRVHRAGDGSHGNIVLLMALLSLRLQGHWLVGSRFVGVFMIVCWSCHRGCNSWWCKQQKWISWLFWRLDTQYQAVIRSGFLRMNCSRAVDRRSGPHVSFSPCMGTVLLPYVDVTHYQGGRSAIVWNDYFKYLSFTRCISG